MRRCLGFTRRHFPIQFHAIEAQIVVADILYGKNAVGLEIIVADMAGNLVVLSSTGSIRHVLFQSVLLSI